MEGSKGAKAKNSNLGTPATKKIKMNRRFSRRGQKQKYNQQTDYYECSNVFGFSWSASASPQTFAFGYNSLPSNLQAVMDQFRYYKVVGFRYYLTVPGVFEHNDFVVAPLPSQSGGTFPGYGEMFAKIGSFTYSAESRQPSIGQLGMSNWKKNAHKIPHSLLVDQPERMFACDPNATDAEHTQFWLSIIPEVVTTNTLKMHWCAKIVFHTPTESGVQLKRAIEMDRKLLADMPMEKLMVVLKEAKQVASAKEQ